MLRQDESSVFDTFVDVFDRCVARLAQAGGMIAALSVFAILVLVGLEVFLRELFDRSTLIADEMSGYLNVAVVYLGLAYTLREGGFIRLELVFNRIVNRAGRLVGWVIVLVSLAYAVVIIWYMIEHALYSYQADIRSMFVSQTPLFWPQLLIPLGVAILALQLVAYLLKRVRDLP